MGLTEKAILWAFGPSLALTVLVFFVAFFYIQPKNGHRLKRLDEKKSADTKHYANIGKLDDEKIQR